MWEALKICSLIIAFCLFRVGDFFGTEHALTGLATEATSRIVSATYPYRICIISGCEGRLLGRDRVSVMTIGNDLKAGDLDRKKTYTTMIERLTAYGARAIVFDISLEGGGPLRDGVLAAIAEAIEKAKAAGVAVIFAQLTDYDHPPILCPDGTSRPRGILAKQLACAASAVGLVNWIQSTELRDRVYPLQIEFGGTGDASVRQDSLAWAAYKNISGLERRQHQDREDDDIFLVWGQGAPGGGASCEWLDPEVGRGVIERLVASVFALFGQAGKTIGATCPYIPAFDAQRLTLDPCSCGRCDEAACNPAFLPIAGRTVFVGMGNPAWEEFATPPIGPQRPGVFTHATAFENLLTLEEDGSGFYRFEESDPVSWGELRDGHWREVVFGHWREWLLGLGQIISAFLIGQFLWPWPKGDSGEGKGSGPKGRSPWRSILYTAMTMLVCRDWVVTAKAMPYRAISWVVAGASYCCRALVFLVLGSWLLPMPNAASVVIVVAVFELTIVALERMVEIKKSEEHAAR